VRLNWTDNSSDEAGFEISRCVGLVCDEISVGANVTTYDDEEVCGGPESGEEGEAGRGRGCCPAFFLPFLRAPGLTGD
jgi:hypothetical protein